MNHILLPESKNYSYVLVVIDSLSLYSVLLPAKIPNAEETAQLLYDNLFMVYGARVLLSDRGAAFRSKLVRTLCFLVGTKQIFTSSRHPQTNSKCKSYNRNISNNLRARCSSEKMARSTANNR